MILVETCLNPKDWFHRIRQECRNLRCVDFRSSILSGSPTSLWRPDWCYFFFFFFLLNINNRFVTRGKATVTLRKDARRLSEDVCFSLATEGKTLDFAVPATVPDDGKSSQVCAQNNIPVTRTYVLAVALCFVTSSHLPYLYTLSEVLYSRQIKSNVSMTTNAHICTIFPIHTS